VIPLEGDFRDLYLVLWGKVWNHDATTRAVEQAQNGLIPWICQRCVGEVCDACGATWEYVGACDFLENNGKSVHTPVFPVGKPCCRTVGCIRYRPSYPPPDYCSR
jgi:hypothetical protein